MVKILIADPNKEWAESTVQFFKGLGYETKMCLTGKQAQVLMYNEKFFAIFLNIDVKDHPGPQVIKFIQINHPGMKLILLAESEELLASKGLDAKILIKQGVSDIYYAPYTPKQLQNALEGHQDFKTLISQTKINEGPSVEEEVSLDDDAFCSIPINDFLSSKAVQFDIFIKLSDKKYLKIIHSGDEFSPERIKKYRDEKNVKFLFFLTEDRLKFIRLNNYMATKIVTNTKIASNMKVNLIKNVANNYVEEVFKEGIKPQLVEEGKNLCNNLYETIQTADKSMAKFLREFSEFNPSLQNHCYLTALFGGMLVKQFSWESKIINETVSMAALLHDIGCLKLENDIKEKSPLQMNDSEMERYKLHTQYSLDMLNLFPTVPSSVKQIVAQHHERIDGSGYPLGLRSLKILLLSQVLALVDEFVRVMVDSKLTPPDALKKMLRSGECIKKHNAIILENFLKIFVDPQVLRANNQK